MIRTTLTTLARAALLLLPSPFPPLFPFSSAGSVASSANNNVGVDDNMNGNYILSPTPNGNDVNRAFPTQYADYPKPPYGKKADYFDVYSPPISTLYSQVFYKGLDPVPLPERIVNGFRGRGMAVIGFEMDQVQMLANGEEWSVPMNAAYCHHFESMMIGGGAKFKKVRPWLYPPNNIIDDDDDDGHHPPLGDGYGTGGHGHPRNQPRYVVVDESLTSGGLPHKQDFGAGNGGEYRKSFHGYAPGYAQVIESPKELQITAMQIDTWHREAMNLTDPNMTFVAGPLPRSSQAPAGAEYSGLLECPITTRIRKIVKGGYVPLLRGWCSDDLSGGDVIGSAQECFGAAESTYNAGGGVDFVTSVVSDSTKPRGCSVVAETSDGRVIKVFYNDMESGEQGMAPCGGGTGPTTDEPTYAGSASSLVNVTATLDPTNDLATLTLTGPSDVWFGIGFGAQSMKDQPYSIIVSGHTGTVTERKLGNHDAGTELTPSLTVVRNDATPSPSLSSEGGTRTIVVTRPLQGLTVEYYTFRTNVTLIPFINAIGSTTDLSYHKAREASTLPILPVQRSDDSHQNEHVVTAVNVCLCSSGPIPFGSAQGTFQYVPVPNQRGEAGTPGKVPFTNQCPPKPRSDLLQMQNPTCDIRTYTGGQAVCHHLWSLLDADQYIPWPDIPLTYRLKFRFWYQDYDPAYHTSVHRTTWGIASPVEYDVPRCVDGVDGCTKERQYGGEKKAEAEEKELWVHTIRGTFLPPSPTGHSLKLAAAHFHCHAPTCLSVELYMCDANNTEVCNATTGTLLCREDPIYGGTGQTDEHKFDEKGYIAQPPCLWGSKEYGLEEPVDVAGKILHAVKTSDATWGHHGEMAWLQMLVFS